MPKSHTNRGALLTSNLTQLQNLIKRDPKAYREEFLQQWTHYQSILRIFQLNPTEHAQHFRELTSFISQVTNHSYCLRIGLCCRLAPKLGFLFHKTAYPKSEDSLGIRQGTHDINCLLGGFSGRYCRLVENCLNRTILIECISSITDPVLFIGHSMLFERSGRVSQRPCFPAERQLPSNQFRHPSIVSAEPGHAPQQECDRLH